MPGTQNLPKIGILSLGDMGSGIARLLTAHGYPVVTNIAGRSKDTLARAESAGVTLVPTDEALVSASTVILSIVPPRDALETARRILVASRNVSLPSETKREKDVFFADMNAISPRSVKEIAALFDTPRPSSSPSSRTSVDDPTSTSTPRPSSGGVTIRFIDGAVLGGPPSPPSSQSASSPSSSPLEKTNPWDSWTRPLLPTSGPYVLPQLFPSLSSLLNISHISPLIGSASALKMCFASLSKGYAAIATQAVTTAKRHGVFAELEDSLQQLAPAQLARMRSAVVGMPPKAYRWVHEMHEISATHAGQDDDEGEGFAPEFMFRGAAEVFRTVAEDTVLGGEKVGKRVRGQTAEDVADAMVEGLRERKRTRRSET
ncbi:6-phosphogluconate dehydrogenase [Echria macrotheca]|uniref:6-phosphogluconate dehydrogenase n=1 Tax=Echria macrotheca TaxID=438768 RepID=A0AAJ0BD89_9PEZI|nr:6-phosphogluconate dehydrogenase [Echria macrotheca]